MLFIIAFTYFLKLGIHSQIFVSVYLKQHPTHNTLFICKLYHNDYTSSIFSIYFWPTVFAVNVTIICDHVCFERSYQQGRNNKMLLCKYLDIGVHACKAGQVNAKRILYWRTCGTRPNNTIVYCLNWISRINTHCLFCWVELHIIMLNCSYVLDCKYINNACCSSPVL